MKFSSLLCALLPALPAPQDDPWLELDETLVGLEAETPESASHLQLGVLVRTFYAYSNDDIALSTDDTSGVDVDDVDISAQVQYGRFQARVNFDLTKTSELEDAYARWEWTDVASLTLGQFRPRFMRSNTVDPETLLFRDRTLIGAAFDVWDVGAQLAGGFEPLGWWVSVSNGDSGKSDHHLYVARLEWGMYDPPTVYGEGAFGSANYLVADVGGSWFKESQAPTGRNDSGWGGDLAVTYGPWALYAEYLNLAGGADFSVFTESAGSLIALVGNSNPWSLTLSRTWGHERRWQSALRWQESDNAQDARIASASLQFMPRARWIWTCELSDYDADSGDDGFLAQFGVSVGRTR